MLESRVTNLNQGLAMKTLWILLAATVPMAMTACGGQSSGAEDSNDKAEMGNEDSEGDDGSEESEGASGRSDQDGPALDDPSEDVDLDGDVDEDDAELTRVSEVFEIELEDVDGDGDVDNEDVAELVKDEYSDMDEDELDVTGDGKFDEEDVEFVAELTQEDLSTDAVSSTGSSGGVTMASPGVAVPPRGIPVPIGAYPESQGIPDLGECEEDYRSAATDYCDVGYTCESGNMWGSCWNEGDDILYCDCGGEGQTGYGYANYQLTDIATADACQTLMDLCTAEEQPEFSGEPECAPEYQSASSDWCDMSLRCSQSAELDGGATALLSQYESVSCFLDDEGTRHCECYGSQQGSMQFDLPDQSGLDTCVAALDICDSAETLETEEPAECEVAYQSSGQGWCDAQLACTKLAIAGDVEIEIAEAANINCQEISEGVYACGCYIGGQSTSFELESDATTWETCSAAIDKCAQ